LTPLADLIARLDALDIRLSVSGETLRCNAPQNALTPALAAEIQARKAELMVHLAQEDAPRATFAQERLWFLDRLEGRPSHYNQADLVLLEGPLDRAALMQAFARIVERHAILRSNFRNEGGSVRLVEHGESSLAVEEIDLSGASDSRAAARQWAREIAVKSFDLETDALLRVGLARLEPERHALLVVMHHIVCDGWSTGVLFRELSALYAKEDLPPLSFSFAEAARRERRRRSGPALSDLSDWWRNNLAGAPSVLEIATDRSASPTRSFSGDRVEFSLSPEQTQALEAIGQAEGASLYMTVLALYAVLLSRHAGTDDVVIGAPVADRDDPASEPLIGHFLNTLALRMRLGGAPTFRQLVRHARSVVLDAFDHKDLPFGQLVQVLNPERNLSHAPVVQAFLNFHNLQRPTLSLRGLDVSFLPGLPIWCDYLTLNLYPKEGEKGRQLSAGLDYNVALFDRSRVEALAERFEALVTAVIATPGSPIDSLPSETARDEAVLETLSGARRAKTWPSLPEAFREQVRRSPDAVALVAGSEAKSYRELDALSDAVSACLFARGIRRGDRVGISLPRGIELVAGLLGILKAGATYVPLDPGFPKDRLDYMVQDAGLSLVLSELPVGKEMQASPEPAGVSGQDPAYLLYTSGSTGRPKGVVVPHGALIHLLSEIAALVELRPADRLVAVTTISFDIAALELFAPLLVGARVIVADRASTMDGRKLATLLSESGATIMQATPATWRLLLASGWYAPAGFRVLCGGEALPTDLARALVAQGAELWNVYGPTETTIWSTAHRVVPADIAGDAAPVVPIGQPIGETLLRICDTALRPVPVGVPGELLIGGAGVALGYNGRPDLTAERFVDLEGTRFYRTGDKARVGHDASLVFLGRADDQIKLHGFRIEPAEIEAALVELPAIHQAVVVRREVQPGDARLVAYLVRAQSTAAMPTDERLREVLGASLPGYMIPSHFVAVASLPLTQNGKIDRRALPDPQQASGPARPQLLTETERAVAAIWEEVLGRRPVGLNDNFFAIGGHSLLTVSVQQRLEQRFKRQVDVASLFLHPTVSALARFIAGAAQPHESASEPGMMDRLQARVLAQRQRRRIVDRIADG
jgi:amino acid adenylation domain-containing protein